MELFILALIAIIIAICVGAERKMHAKNNMTKPPQGPNKNNVAKTHQRPSENRSTESSQKSGSTSYHRIVEINHTLTSRGRQNQKTENSQSSYTKSNNYYFTEPEQNTYKKMKKRIFDDDYDEFENWYDDENRVSRFEHRKDVIYDALVNDEFNSSFNFKDLNWYCKLKSINKKKRLFFYTTVAGVCHHSPSDVSNLKNGQDLLLQRDPNNTHDKNAIKIFNPKSGKLLGFVWGNLAVFLAPVMDKGVRLNCVVEDIEYGITGRDSNTHCLKYGQLPHIIICKK